MQVHTQVIDEDTTRFFIWAVGNFFQNTTTLEAEIGAPFLCDNFQHNDYTGIIGVSGSRRGTLYFTIGSKCMDELIKKGCPHVDKNNTDAELYEELVQDYTGEIANTVSGNVRNYLGERFLISVPIVLKKLGEHIKFLDDQCGIVFPITWQDHHCHLVLCFDKTHIAEDFTN